MDRQAEFLQLVDPELRAAAVMMRENYRAFTPMTLDKLPARRESTASRSQPPLDDVPYVRQEIAGPDGAAVPVYIVNARPGAERPGIFHVHGGGFTASSAIGGMRNLQHLAVTLDCPIVTVDYTLAPEATYERSIEQNYAALLWLYRNAARIGFDRDRIALLGESAGGGHAAMLAIAARDRGEVPVAFQALVYPMLDDRIGSTRHLPEHIGYFGWNADGNRFAWRCFLGMEPGGANVPTMAAPARVDDLRGLPPTFIGVGSIDILVMDSVEYAGRLITAGVPTELIVVPGAFHGFDAYGKDAACARSFTAAKVAALRRGLGLPEVNSRDGTRT